LTVDFDDARINELIDLVFEYVCAQPLSAFVDPARVLPALDDALEPSRTADFHQWIGVPLRERLIARAKKSQVLLGAWLPEALAKALDEQLGRPVKLPRKAIDDAVASEQVREGVRQLVTETLENFVSKGVSGGDSSGSSSGGSGLKSMLSFGARAAAGVGKGLLGGLSDELQKQLQDRAKTFVDASMAAAQKRLAERIASEETAKTLGKRRQKFFQRLLARSESEAADWIEKAARWKDVDDSLPKVVAHNLARKELRDAIEEETRAVFAQLADETVGALLERAGLKEHARQWARAQGLPLARGFLATEGAQQWLAPR
jgi:hypothetical protein